MTLPLAGGKKKPVVKLGKKTIKTEVADGQLVLNVDPSISGRWVDRAQVIAGGYSGFGPQCGSE